MVDQERPNGVQDAPAFPALQRAMDRGIVAELFWQVVPLTAGSCPVQDPIEALALVSTRASRLGSRVKFVENRHDDRLPKRVRHFPNGCQRVCVRRGRRRVFHLAQDYRSQDECF